MSEKRKVCIDGNTAAAHIAYAFSEVAAIYPITPSSDMGQYAEAWAANGLKNLEGLPVQVVEMQSEAGAAGALHGSLSAGSLSTTFTASQGLLLMIPNMYKIAGEMLPTVFHVAARSLATQSLSIFGDHSDVMACRNTGFAMLASAGTQENLDLALVAHLATLKAEVPFVHFFDGFRTSHEIQKVETITYEEIETLVEPKYIERFRNRAMRPEKPIAKSAAQNPDVYFQGRERTNLFYDEVPKIVQGYMDKVYELTGRSYHPFDYVGDPEATDVIVSMGSSCEAVARAVDYLNERGAKVGLVKVRLYRPFSIELFSAALPESVERIAVLDRTKEPGSVGEPLFLDVVASLAASGRGHIRTIGGRYGLSSKEFTPTMVVSIFKHLKAGGFHGFTVGIVDDVSLRSLPAEEEIDVEGDDVRSCMFWGFGSDGMVSANKNTIKILGDETDLQVQAYFVYDSKKSGGVTISHLRFGHSSVNMPWLITKADFVACNKIAYIGRYKMLEHIKVGGTFLLNSNVPSNEVFVKLTKSDQEIIRDRRIRFYNINANKIAKDAGMENHINTVMQTAFFILSGVLPEDEAIDFVKASIEKSFAYKGGDVIAQNFEAVENTAKALRRVEIPMMVSQYYSPKPLISPKATAFSRKVIAKSMALRGDEIPVSQMPFDGVMPTGTTRLEKRGVAPFVPKWDAAACIQCNQCVQACPHATIRGKQIRPEDLKNAPPCFKVVKSNTKNGEKLEFRIQIYPEDCQGCGVCIIACPVGALSFSPIEDERAKGESEAAEYFDALPDIIDGVNPNSVKGMQFKPPLFEFSGACAGCGETPYIKLITQICGPRMLIANATGCSSIYGGTFPTVPYTKDSTGCGPAWGNSLFEDNAEYGFGMRLAVDNNRSLLYHCVDELLKLGTSPELTEALEYQLEHIDDVDDEARAHQKRLGELIKDAAICELAVPVRAAIDSSTATAKATADQLVANLNPDADAATEAEREKLLLKMLELKDYFIDKSVWIFGGDGWAYDIGFAGLDHVVAAGRNVNILVLDTESYSNTGGQISKSTPRGAVGKFAYSGKDTPKKNLGLMCMSYGYVYVGSIALGANRNQAQQVLMEAEAYDGPSIVFAYSPCIAHGINMMMSQEQEKLAVAAGYWPLYRFDPRKEKGKRFRWETRPPKEKLRDFLLSENRYARLLENNPEQAEEIFAIAQEEADERYEMFKSLAKVL